MLQVTIKDVKTNEVIYDEQVSMVIMQATEKNGTRSIRRMTDDANLIDMLGCIEAVKKASQEVSDIVLKSINQALDKVLSGVMNDAE